MAKKTSPQLGDLEIATISLSSSIAACGKCYQSIPRQEQVVESKRENLIKPSKKRYFVLFLFVCLCTIKAFQWICFASITSTLTKFYNVDNIAINWTTIVFMFTYLILALPTTWLMNLIGLRKSILTGAIGTTTGIIIKCFSVNPNGFVVSMIGHLLIGFSEPFFFGVYSQLAAVWFPDHQVASAVSVGVIGDQIGLAIGFIVPSLMVQRDDPDDMDTVQIGLFRLFLAQAIIAVTLTVMVFIFFDEQPKYAPGFARLKQIQDQREQRALERDLSLTKRLFKPAGDLKHFMTNKDFLLLLVGFGLNCGSNYALHTVLNQMILAPFLPGESLFQRPALLTGDSGLVLILAGSLGLMAFGHLLDKYHKFKLTTILNYFTTIGLVLMFTASLRWNNELFVCLAAALLGFFMTAYAVCGFEYGVEITYPRSELLSSTLLNISAQIFGIPISFGASLIVDSYGSLAGGAFFSAILLMGLVFTCLQGGDLRRQTAAQSSKQEVDGKKLGCNLIHHQNPSLAKEIKI